MAQFVRGVSGNPAGRQPGTGVAQRLTAAIEGDLQDVISAMVIAAKNGDTAAAKLLLDRCAPPLKPVCPPVRFDLDPEATPRQQAAAVMRATADGLLPPDLAASILSALASIESLPKTLGDY